jgi:hypothetical protein
MQDRLSTHGELIGSAVKQRTWLFGVQQVTLDMKAGDRAF